ncbi:MAG: hypothetical protein M3494_15325 [Actinomycetota bacterium]|nr:hypothetical protein [Actinomycetota bacterium]
MRPERSGLALGNGGRGEGRESSVADREAENRGSRLSFLASLVVCLVFFSSCGGAPPALDLGWEPDSPAVYRVSASAESGFSGAVSDLEAATEMTAAFRVSPAPDSSAEVEVLYLAANVRDAFGEPVALNLGRIAGSGATVRFGSPGVVSGVEGDGELLEAPVPLISVESVIWHLFPPLPEGSFRPEDTWTGDMPPTFPNLGEEPVRMRYVADGVDASSGTVEGYELSVEPRSFEAETPGGGVSGEGHLDIVFEGELDEANGYQRIERSSEFDSDFIRLEGGAYANGNSWMREEMVVERLSQAEQFGLDP